MEDRYLYKAKTTPKEKGEFNNVWVTGNLIVSNGKYYIHPVGNVVNVKNETGRIIVMHEVIPDTICRCTESKDKNGKLIWENDIVRCKVGTAKVIWNKSEWRIEWLKNDLWRKDLYYWAVEDIQRTVVIGNIFDNKELLESEEN
nr:MAG TPA: YopX protein [Bacteriophage sp.]